MTIQITFFIFYFRKLSGGEQNEDIKGNGSEPPVEQKKKFKYIEGSCIGSNYFQSAMY